jgi:uncharacterized OsmC-like protein
MAMSNSPESVRLTQRQGYQFDNHFGPALPDLLTDEPPPLGTGAGPSPTQLLAAAVGNCLSASLVFALFKHDAGGVRCDVDLVVGRNADKRLRVTGVTARLTIGVPGGTLAHIDRVLASFEDFCTVTASVRAAIPVTVQVFDATGVQLK